ncbi:MAG TPA: DUF6678 family protein [Propionibacteriaceae bacterium]|nr:DUF6678 family protein [Propionibacteriaceae bacterium]
MSGQQFVTLATADHWAELQALMVEMSLAAPYWRMQSTTGTQFPSDDGWHADWDHQFRLVDYKYIEWCELVPRPDDTGLTLQDICQACEAIGFEVEAAEDRVRVLGYRRLD